MFVETALLSVLVAGLAGQPAEAGDHYPGPRLVLLGEDHVDLGKIREGEVVDAEFTIKNEGDADLVIDRVKASCGCTTVKLSEEEKVIAPGGTQKVTVKFDSTGRPGDQRKGVTVHTNDPEHDRLNLTFRVFVETLFRTLPPYKYHFRNVRRGELLARPIDVVPTVPEGEMEILSVDLPPSQFRADVMPLQEAAEGRGSRIKLEVAPTATLGTVSTTADITVRIGEKTETRQLKLLGTIVGDLEVLPPLIRLERPTVRGVRLRPVVLRSTTKEPVNVIEASAGIGFDTDIQPSDDGRSCRVYVGIADDAEDGPRGTFLDIRTDSLVQPLIRVPVFVYVAPRINAEPPLVLLRPGSSEGARRRVSLENARMLDFNILSVHSDLDGVAVAPVAQEEPLTGIQYLDVTLADGDSASAAKGTIVVETDVPGAETLRLPVVIDQAGGVALHAASHD